METRRPGEDVEKTTHIRVMFLLVTLRFDFHIRTLSFPSVPRK